MKKKRRKQVICRKSAVLMILNFLGFVFSVNNCYFKSKYFIFTESPWDVCLACELWYYIDAGMLPCLCF